MLVDVLPLPLLPPPTPPPLVLRMADKGADGTAEAESGRCGDCRTPNVSCGLTSPNAAELAAELLASAREGTGGVYAWACVWC
jgi:hypothetical protein